jgi:hypothetical protein
MPTEADPDPPPAPLPDMPAVLLAATTAAGFDLDLEELVVVAAHEPALVLQLLTAATRLTANRWARQVLADAEETLQHIGMDEQLRLDLLDDLVTAINQLDWAHPALTQAVARACGRLYRTNLGLAWPTTGDADHDPPAPSSPDQPAT